MHSPQLAYPDLRPAWPIDPLPEPIRGAVLFAIARKGIPAAVAITDALGAAAAVVHCGFDCIAPDGESLPATLNTCAVAPSAAGKGRSIRFFFRHFLEAQKGRRSWPVEDAERCDAREAPPRKPLVEAMINRLSFPRLMKEIDGVGMSLTIQREEGASFLKTDLFKHDTDALTQLWSGDPPLDHFVMGNELVAVDARVSLGFRIQPELMYDYLRGPGRLTYKLGFWPRTIAGCHDPKLFPENERSPPTGGRLASSTAFHDRMEELATWTNSLRAIDAEGRMGVKLDSEAAAFMLELEYRMRNWKGAYYQDIEEAAGRAWENTLRLAVVLHVFCTGSGEVTLDMAQRAWAVVEWSLSQHRLIFIEAPAIHVRNQGIGIGRLAPSPIGRIAPAAPRPVKLPRPLQDAQWVLTCLNRLSFNVRHPLLRDVRLLAGLPENRLSAALEWLKLERALSIRNGDNPTVVRYR